MNQHYNDVCCGRYSYSNIWCTSKWLKIRRCTFFWLVSYATDGSAAAPAERTQRSREVHRNGRSAHTIWYGRFYRHIEAICLPHNRYPALKTANPGGSGRAWVPELSGYPSVAGVWRGRLPPRHRFYFLLKKPGGVLNGVLGTPGYSGTPGTNLY